ADIVSEKKDIAITPLISGKHGIGKSQMIKSIASDLGGVCITIEGGTLKEGEITGLPYQYKDESGSIRFRFLPYYAVERIQTEQKRLFQLSGKKIAETALSGDENRYAIEDLTPMQKLEMLRNGIVKPVIIFIDEINRTENSVYKELMNILLTRSVNGYCFPWWVLFVGAMNPSTQNSLYATNEMDPAQLDRFLKIKVSDNTREWLKYGASAGISPEILTFIKDNPKCLSSNDKELQDDEKPSPSPRGWDMVDSLLKSEPLVRAFFTDKENDPKVVEKDMKNLVSAKLGASVATMFFASMVSQARAIMPEEIFADDENLIQLSKKIDQLSSAKKIQTCDLMLDYLKENIEFMMLSKTQFEINKKQLSKLVNLMDSSVRLLFAQKLSAAVSGDGNSLIELLFDVFEKDLIDMLDLSDATRKLIEES
ncbi:MAG: AAA family ATPase, partial [Oscillospiraceae bacterium]|nr:AAA family ATPase [Oscillospiraceae bacterium]